MHLRVLLRSLVALTLAGCAHRAEVLEVTAPSGATTDRVVVEESSAGGTRPGIVVVEQGPPPPGATGPATASCPAPASFALNDCSYSCEVDVVRGTSTCTGPITVMSQSGPTATLRADLHGQSALLASVEACEPDGWMFHVSDSPSGDGWGGDAGDASNDAELHVNGSASQRASTSVYVSDDAPPGQPRLFATDPATFPTGACMARTFYVADQQVAIDDGFAVCSPALLRIDPPSDREGTPDALFWIGIDRTVGNGARSGSGIVRVALCLR